MATVQVDRVTMRRDETLILDDVSLDVGDGELLVILGASGQERRHCCGLWPVSTRPTRAGF